MLLFKDPMSCIRRVMVMFRAFIFAGGLEKITETLRQQEARSEVNPIAFDHAPRPRPHALFRRETSAATIRTSKKLPRHCSLGIGIRGTAVRK